MENKLAPRSNLLSVCGRIVIDKIRQLNIEISLEQLRQIAIYKDPALLEDAVDTLRKAGLK
jgi:hypothetical protein